MDILNMVFHISLAWAGILLILSVILFFRLKIGDVLMELSGRTRAAAIRQLDERYAARPSRAGISSPPGNAVRTRGSRSASHTSNDSPPRRRAGGIQLHCLFVLILSAALLPVPVCMVRAAQTQESRPDCLAGEMLRGQRGPDGATETESESKMESETETAAESMQESETETDSQAGPGSDLETEETSAPADIPFTITISGLSVTRHGKTAYPVTIRDGGEEIRVTDDSVQREVYPGETLSFLVEEGFILERDGLPISSIVVENDEDVVLTVRTIERTVCYHDALGNAPAPDTLDILMDDFAVEKTPDGFDADIYDFLGWYEDRDGLIDLDNGNEKVEMIRITEDFFTDPAEDIDLYALYGIRGALSITGEGPVSSAPDTNMEIRAVSGGEDPGKDIWFGGDVTLAFSSEVFAAKENEHAANDLHFSVHYETREGTGSDTADEEILDGTKLVKAMQGSGKVSVFKLEEAYVTAGEEGINYVYRTDAQAAVLTVHQDLCRPVVSSVQIDFPDSGRWKWDPVIGNFFNRNICIAIQAADVSSPPAPADAGESADAVNSGVGEITLVLHDVIRDGIARSTPLQITKTAGLEDSRAGFASFMIPAQWLEEAGSTGLPVSLQGRLQILVSDKAGNTATVSPDDKEIARTHLETDDFFYETILPYSRLMIDGEEYHEETETEPKSDISDASFHKWLKKDARLILEAHDDADEESSSQSSRKNAGVYILDFTVNGEGQAHTYMISPEDKQFEQRDDLHSWISDKENMETGNGTGNDSNAQAPNPQTLKPGKAFSGTVPIAYDCEELRDGKNTIAASVYDLAGNVSRAAEYVFYRDSLKPSSSLTGEDGKTVYTEDTVSYYTGSAGSDGEYWLRSSCGSLVLTVRDGEPGDSEGEASETSSGLARVSWTLTDPEGKQSSAVTYRSQDINRFHFSHTFSYRDLKPGKNILRVEAEDQVGNTDESAYVFFVDKKPPVIADLRVDGFERSMSYGVFSSKALAFTVKIEDGKYSSGIKTANLIYHYSDTDQEDKLKQETIPLTKGSVGDSQEGESQTGESPAGMDLPGENLPGTQTEGGSRTEILGCTLDRINTQGHIEIYLEDEAGNHYLYTDLGEKGKGFPSITSGQRILKNHFVMEDMAPELTLQLTDPAYTDSKRKNADDDISKPFKWYQDKQITLSWEIDDHAEGHPFAGVHSAEIKINGTALAGRIYEGKREPARSSTDSLSLDEESCIKYATNGKNKLEILVSDAAGNTVTKTCYVYVDNTAPKVSGFTFTGTNSGKTVRQSCKPVTVDEYGFFSSENATVTVSVEDKAPSSGIGTVRLLKLSADGKMTVEERKLHVRSNPSEKGSTTGKAVFLIKKNFKGQIYACVTDHAGNDQTSGEEIPGTGEGKWRHPYGVITESKASHESSRHIQIKALTKPDAWLDGRRNPLFKGDAQVNITITDTWSGIRSAEFSVEAKSDTAKNFKDSVSIGEDGHAGGGWIVKKKDRNLVTEMTRTITVANNSNDIAIHVRMTDNAGNSTADSFLLSIDKEAPVITVRFDPSDKGDDSTWTGYFCKPRTMTVTVKERNFDPQKVRFQVTKDQKDFDLSPSFDEKEVSGSDGKQHRIYTMKYTFRARDSDFTFALSAQDKAGHKTTNDMVDYGSAAERKVAGKFTIDQVKPVIKVSLSGTKGAAGEGQEGIVYYQSRVSAKVTLTERNFDPERFSYRIDAEETGDRSKSSNDAKGQRSGEVSSGSWSSSGDTHHITFSFSAENRYTIVSIKARDKSGNGSDNWSGPTFIVDLAEPQIRFYTDSSMKEELDHTARGGKITPFVVVTDANYERMDMELTGYRQGDLTKRMGQEKSYDYRWEKGSLPDRKEGSSETRCFANFKKGEAYDDIYILTVTAYDKAGRVKGPESVVFSVNRYGSTYLLDEETRALNDTYYIQEESPVTIIEINDVPLDKDKTQVIITRDGVPVTLREKLDYSMSETAPLKAEDSSGDEIPFHTRSHWYEYRYVIYKENFSREGRYSVNIQTTDKTQDRANTQTNETSGHKQNLFARSDLTSDSGSRLVIGDENNKANAPVMFIIDKTPPGLALMELPKDQAFRQDRLDLSIICADAVKLDHVIFTLDGKEECIPAEEFEANGGEIVRTIGPGRNRQEIKLRALDMAGNESRYPAGHKRIAVLVTSSWLYQFMNHPLWMMIAGSSIGGLFALAIFLARKRKQKQLS